jgi:glycogen operon protein
MTEKKKDDVVYIALNTYWEDVRIELPILPEGRRWRQVVDTFEISSITKGKVNLDEGVVMRPRSLRIFVMEDA